MNHVSTTFFYLHLLLPFSCDLKGHLSETLGDYTVSQINPNKYTLENRCHLCKAKKKKSNCLVDKPPQDAQTSWKTFVDLRCLMFEILYVCYNKNLSMINDVLIWLQHITQIAAAASIWFNHIFFPVILSPPSCPTVVKCKVPNPCSKLKRTNHRISTCR